MKTVIFKMLIFLLATPLLTYTLHRSCSPVQPSFVLVALSIFRFTLPVSLTDPEILVGKRERKIMSNLVDFKGIYFYQIRKGILYFWPSNGELYWLVLL